MIKNNYKYKEDWAGEISMYIGIPIVGFLLTFIFVDERINYFTITHLYQILVTILITGINWAGCRYIVIKLWNKYPWHIKPVKHILVEVPLMLGFTIGLMALSALVYTYASKTPFNMADFWRDTSIVIILVFFLVSYHEALFFYHQWKENFNKSLKLEKENIKAEYNVLKNQVNPHFLFNNLNTLITYVEDNEEATNYIHNLSDFLRYSLDERNIGVKTLKDELEMVEKYIYLQKSRYGDNLILDINIPSKYYENILPSLSLQMLVENAIKHNIISKNKPLVIKIKIEDSGYLIVENNIQRKQDAISTNRGLNNLINRYSFLSEKNIIISEKNNKFIVKLPLVLPKNI